MIQSNTLVFPVLANDDFGRSEVTDRDICGFEGARYVILQFVQIIEYCVFAAIGCPLMPWKGFLLLPFESE